MSLRVNFNILNQKGTPAFYSDVFANRPAFGFAGRVFISTDTGAIYEDTGSAWTLIADAGAGTTGTLQQVTTNGNTTAQGLVVTAGNIAIGTATAGAPLDIHCTGTAAQFNGTGTNNAYVFFQNAGASKWRLGNNYNAGQNSLDFYSFNAGGVAASLNGNGSLLLNFNLGIKQTSTINQVSGYNNIAADSGGFYLNNGGANSAYLNIGSLTASRSYAFPDASGTLATTANLSSYLPLSGGTLSAKLTIGNFDGEAIKLQEGTGAGNTYLRFYNSSGTGLGYIGSFDSSGSQVMTIDSSTTDLSLNGNANAFIKIGGTTRMKLSSSSNGTVTMGTSTGAANSINFAQNYSNGQPGWDVYGSTSNLIFEFNGNTKALYVGNLGTGILYSNAGILTSTNPSDSRLKENIEVLKYGLKDILKLRPVTYNWKKDEANQGIQFGFIAQEVQEIMPEAIKEFGTDIKYLGLEKDAIYAALINAIKELNDKIDNLKN